MPDPTPRSDARSDARPNRLAREKSPYLLQHAFNPVDWVPWGEEAFARARAEDCPIFNWLNASEGLPGTHGALR